MPSFLVDTNALLDLVSADRPRHTEVSDFFVAAVGAGAPLYALSSCLKDVYYIYERHYGAERRARQIVRLLRGMLSLAEVNGALIDQSLELDEPDLEDAMVRAAAENLGVAGIVSYDRRAFERAAVPRLTAAEAQALLG